MHMELIQTIPPDVARKLGYYIYAYVNPLDGHIFYVGKGKGRRVLAISGIVPNRESSQLSSRFAQLENSHSLRSSRMASAAPIPRSKWRPQLLTHWGSRSSQTRCAAGAPRAMVAPPSKS
jgi:hypothetical protein